VIDIADPRVFPEHIDAVHAPLLELASASLAASSSARADEIDGILVKALAERVGRGDGLLLAELFAAAPSGALARHLWRRLIAAWREASRAAAGEGVAATLFALPVVIVAGSQPGAAALALAGILQDCDRIAAILQEHGALAGNRTFALASALATADAVDVPRLPTLLGWQRQALAGGGGGRDLAPTPIAVQAGQEGVHLRFLIGTALAAPTVDLLGTADTTRWVMPLAQELARQLAVPGATVLALPRAPLSPPAALQQGRAAQRAVGAQLFASNAIRRLRASVGEPSAVISAHRCPAAPGGGELRLSLSSVFDPRKAEGFRCPLFPGDTAGDVAVMLIELLRDCRVVDVRVLSGIHADRDPATGTTLLFKPGAIPESAAILFH
jgi:hypothetical protein